MEQILHKHGISREDKNVYRNHMAVDEYKQFAQKSQLLKILNAQITELKKKPHTEFTAEDAVLLNNQNDYMRCKIIELGQTIEKLSRQVGARFVSVNIFDLGIYGTQRAYAVFRNG